MNKKQIHACKLSIDILGIYRRQHFATGKSAAKFGFIFGIAQEKKYDEFTEAIETLLDMVNNGVTEQVSLFKVEATG